MHTHRNIFHCLIVVWPSQLATWQELLQSVGKLLVSYVISNLESRIDVALSNCQSYNKSMHACNQHLQRFKQQNCACKHIYTQEITKPLHTWMQQVEFMHATSPFHVPYLNNPISTSWPLKLTSEHRKSIAIVGTAMMPVSCWLKRLSTQRYIVNCQAGICDRTCLTICQMENRHRNKRACEHGTF